MTCGRAYSVPPNKADRTVLRCGMFSIFLVEVAASSSRKNNDILKLLVIDSSMKHSVTSKGNEKGL